MTIKEMTKQVYGLSIAGYFNGEKFSYSEFYNYVRKHLNDSLIMEISLRDGRWYFEMIKKGSICDYFIPDDRDQEKHIINRLPGLP